MAKYKTPAEAVRCVQSGHRVFFHGAAATPFELIDALVEQHDRLRDVEIMHMHTMGSARYADPDVAKSFRVLNLFVGSNLRPKMQIGCGRVDAIPIFLSEIPILFRNGTRAPDVAFIQVSPPDGHGYCTLGTSVDSTRAAVETAKIIVGLINRQMPRAHGDGFIHIDDIDHYIEIDRPIPEVFSKPPSAEVRQIGRHAASIIEDGSTLQMGIGEVPDAVLHELRGHKHLGIHTEMWSDGVLELVKNGAIDNTQKVIHPGKIVGGFCMGTKAVYDFLHDNPASVLLDIAYVNNPSVIARNPKVVAINSAVEVDLTGQVCADSIGHKFISGVGGQMDFIRGAAISKGGRPIIALTSMSAKGFSRIVPTLRAGAGVVTTRYHVRYVITEYGVADLWGKTLNERAAALTSVAHPSVREMLERAWREECYPEMKRGD